MEMTTEEEALSLPVIEVHEAETDQYYSDEHEAAAVADGFARQYGAKGEWPRDPESPADEPFFRLAAGQYVPVRIEADWFLPSWDAALDLAASYEARGAVKIVLTETSATLVREMAYERAAEARVG